MADLDNAVSFDLARRVEQNLRSEKDRREPVLLTWITVFATILIFLITLLIEWNSIGFAFDQLFPTLSDGSGGLHGKDVLAFVSVFGILLGDLLLDKASAQWSERARKRLMFAGIASLLLFIVGIMVLTPVSTWQANDPSVINDGNSGLSMLAYLAFSLMLAALFPLSLLTNFVLLEMLKAAVARIARTREVDARIHHKRALLRHRETTLAALGEAKKQYADIPSDDQVTETFAAHAAAVIGEAAGRVHEIIRLREAATSATAESGVEQDGTPKAPFKATNDDYWNNVSIERLQELLKDLSSFTPAAVRQVIRRDA